jgi:hypothetical protein
LIEQSQELAMASTVNNGSIWLRSLRAFWWLVILSLGAIMLGTSSYVAYVLVKYLFG